VTKARFSEINLRGATQRIMALYFLVLDCQAFQNDIRPALAASWRRRSFEPCRTLAARLLPAAREFATRYHLADSEPLLARVAEGLPFDRVIWQHLAGEMLWFCAAEIPEIETNMDALACLLASNAEPREMRADWPPIVQAHHGSRDLVFGGGFYRPEHAGFNDSEDVTRLAAYLAAVRPASWKPDDLAALPDLPEDEREEELAFLRDWFPALQGLYTQAAERGRVIVCETMM
jgi:hypothetical protein